MTTVGVRQLASFQLGVETTAGTEVDASIIWRGPITFPEDTMALKQPKEDVAIFGGTDRTYISQYSSKWPIGETEATFEQFPLLLTGSVKALTSGVADGSGSGKIYAYPVSTTSANTISTFTLEAYDNIQEEQALCGFVKSWKLSGKGGSSDNALMMSAELMGQQLAPGTKTGSLSLVPVEEMIFSKCKLFIDAIGGTMGTTQKTNTFLAFDLSFDSGIKAVWTGEGAGLNYSFIKVSEPKLTGSVLFEHDATSVAEKAIWRAQTPQLMRIQCLGTTLSTSGTTYSVKTLNLDMAMKFTKFDAIGEQDGNDICLGNFESKYNATAAQWATFTVVNQLATLE